MRRGEKYWTDQWVFKILCKIWGSLEKLNCGQSAQIHPLGPFAHLFNCWDFNVGISDFEVSGWIPRYNPITRDALLRDIIPAWLRFTLTFNYFKLAVFFFFPPPSSSFGNGFFDQPNSLD